MRAKLELTKVKTLSNDTSCPHGDVNCGSSLLYDPAQPLLSNFLERNEGDKRRGGRSAYR